jgi:signal transduction histidine kinase
LKIKGLKKRWLINTMLITFVIVLVGLGAFAVAVSSNYYLGIQISLENKAKTATDFFANYITKTYAEYYQSAYKYTEKFDERDILELQFINSRGRVEISTYGITAGDSPGTDDITQAIETKKISVWRGKSPTTGERIIAVSSPMIYSTGQVVGVMRYVSSLKKVDKQVVLNILAAAGIGVLILVFVFTVNLFFIRSIVRPIRQITSVTRRIADGSYGVLIENNYNDEIGELSAAINEMSIAISRTDKMKSEFISSVSHELRTPLTAITGWGETLMYDTEMSDDSKKGISIILKEARRLTRMVEELLDFTRMENGRFTVNISQIDVEAELEEAVFTYGEILRQEQISLEYSPTDEGLPMIAADPQRLKQVFLNILDNAAKYGREGKRIIVDIGLEQGYEGSDKDYVKITVRDFGPGIPEDELPHVKEKFYKGSSKERGSGIGLAVCDEIVRLHRGILNIANAEGGGTVVTVLLPVS